VEETSVTSKKEGRKETKEERPLKKVRRGPLEAPGRKACERRALSAQLTPYVRSARCKSDAFSSTISAWASRASRQKPHEMPNARIGVMPHLNNHREVNRQHDGRGRRQQAMSVEVSSCVSIGDRDAHLTSASTPYEPGVSFLFNLQPVIYMRSFR